MKINWIDKDICKLDIDPMELDLQETIDQMLDNQIETLITVDKYEYRICWGVGEERKIRRYYHTFGDIDNPIKWEIANLLQFIEYEVKNCHKIGIWIADITCRDDVINHLDEYIRNGQKPRATLPKTLHFCSGCSSGHCETELLTHTSSIDDFKKIISEMKLKSAALHRKISKAELQIEERNAAGDHPDYFDYVMMSWGNCGTGQRLVNERRLGHSPTEDELMNDFIPGISFYFETSRILEHNNYVDDGYHAAKVKNELELQDYLFAIIIPKSKSAELLPLIPDVIVSSVIVIDDLDFHRYCIESYLKVVEKLALIKG